MLTRYARDDHLKPIMEPFLREFVCILTYGGNKYKDITRNIEGIYKMKPYEICKLLTAVIEEKEITVRVDEKIILQHCLDILVALHRVIKVEMFKHFTGNSAVYRRCYMTLFHQKKINMCCRISLKIHRFSRSLKIFVACQRISNSTFFVCHSHKDSDWVHNMLLRHLESTFDEQDIAFKGMYNILCVYK
jgi:hypothetical protein